MHADEPFTIALDDFDFDTELDLTAWESVARASPMKHEDDVLTGAVRKLHELGIEPSDRTKALRALADTLAVVRGFMLSREHRELFEPGGLLDPYLSSVRVWAIDVAEALASRDPLAPHVIVWLYERATFEQARLERVIDALPNDLVAALHELFVAVPKLKRAL